MNRPIMLALMLVGAASVANAQQKDFSWEGRIAPGRWLYVRNLNGPIRVEKASGDKAEVTGVKRWRRGDPDRVRIEVQKGNSSGDVIICAFFTEDASCDEDGYRSHSRDNRERSNNNDVSVEFTIRLPEGVKLGVSTVNGGLRVSGATSEVRAETVNGRVEATSSGGPVRAGTVNGDVDVRMRELGQGDLEFSTVNGSVSVEVPGNLDAEIDMRTVNGSLSADFPITLSGRVNPRHLHATIGKGGRRIKFETVNGSVELRKSS
jgi:DUF4097 and DUF4098 domain-containing protein YvlB